MRTETVMYYRCGYCNCKYSTEEEARECEDAHTFEATDPKGSKPKYNTGDFVYDSAGGLRWYFILGENWKPYWDAKTKCWAYRNEHTTTNIPEPELKLAMTASEYRRRVQDIKDKLGEDYTVEIEHYGDCIGFSVSLELKGEQNGK